jgi:hypothetical protein
LVVKCVTALPKLFPEVFDEDEIKGLHKFSKLIQRDLDFTLFKGLPKISVKSGKV